MKDGKARDQRAYKKAHYEANKEQILARQKAYVEANIDIIHQRRNAWYQANRERILAKHAAYYAANRELINQRRQESHARKKGGLKAYYLNKYYGITYEEWKLLYESQAGLCAICKRAFNGDKDTHVDHNHVTGKIRGLLCSNCNSGMGLLGDDIPRLEAAISYLKKGD